MTKIYTGIGSRRTPDHVLEVMHRLGVILAKEGWVLRSGAAAGADSAFEAGCDEMRGPKQIYIPWDGFNRRYIRNDPFLMLGANESTEKLASEIHPNWSACSNGARALHARNVGQILGPHLNQPTDLVICWTPNGNKSGGTGQAIRLAERMGITVHDLGNPNVYEVYERRSK